MAIVPFGWLIVDYFEFRDDMDVFNILVCLRLLLVCIILVFLIFFYIGIREVENVNANETNERASNERASYMSASSPKPFTLRSDKAFDVSESAPKSKDELSLLSLSLKDDLSWY